MSVSSINIATINSNNNNNNNNNNSSTSIKVMSEEMFISKDKVQPDSLRYPHCIVWTPIPLLTWLFPFIGHMGIATTIGIIRDFAGPYYVSEDNMGFGNPTRYLQLNINDVGVSNVDKGELWDRSVYEASEEYKKRMHNLCCDNCHSHVAYALNLMKYDKSTSWNMVKLCFWMFFRGRYVSFCGFLKQWLPFLLVVGVVITIVLATQIK